MLTKTMHKFNPHWGAGHCKVPDGRLVPPCELPGGHSFYQRNDIMEKPKKNGHFAGGKIMDKKGVWLDEHFPSKVHSSRTLRDEGIFFDESSDSRLVHNEPELKEKVMKEIILMARGSFSN